MKIKVGEVFHLERSQVSVDVIVVSISEDRMFATIREIVSGKTEAYAMGHYLDSEIETINCKGVYDFNILYGQEIAENLKEKLINDFKNLGTIDSNLVIESSKDMYDFSNVVEEQNYSPSLKKLIEDNRPTAN